MDIEKFVTAIGGRKSLIEETGLSKGRISQWVTSGNIPKPWRKYFLEKYPTECADCGLSNEQEAA